MGKMLIDKLLRTCTNVENVYLLIRPKKGKDIHTRVEEIFDDPVNFKGGGRMGRSVFCAMWGWRQVTVLHFWKVKIDLASLRHRQNINRAPGIDWKLFYLLLFDWIISFEAISVWRCGKVWFFWKMEAPWRINFGSLMLPSHPRDQYLCSTANLDAT